ncbi:hypothetical protein FRP1_30165 (plasmid) [Pseudonocardia sp. EC080625-04]|uniref:hypothetical protein n=1 Tax=unclassified Pseudonocardia TaxID=2619320 RepID=UPI0006CB76BB|nr:MULTISPECIES: hypothetical protein [unclassified Pseudonocardia]ALE76985.1 hypothetical protein FRP1_30165 [Pseudonocardia sp. EC080625-04]ALL85913.1 hypothetical protein AD017_32990 [Pseudonocardia sp. EC080619-01]
MSSTSATRRVDIDTETGLWTLDGVIGSDLSINDQRVLEDLLVDIYEPTDFGDAELGDDEPPF